MPNGETMTLSRLGNQKLRDWRVEQQVLVILSLLFLVSGLWFPISSMAADVSIDPSGRYYRDSSGKPIFLIGYYAWGTIAPSGSDVSYQSMLGGGGPYKINY